MKITTPTTFQPVTIVIETEEEMDILYSGAIIARSISVNQKVRKCFETITEQLRRLGAREL